MNIRIFPVVACGVVGAVVGAAAKSGWAPPSSVSVGRHAATASNVGLPATAQSASESSEARPNPVPLPLPRPSLDEVKATAPDDRMRLLVRWLPEATAGDIAALAEDWFANSSDSGPPEWQALCSRWVEVAPGAAMAFGKRYTDRFMKMFGPGHGLDGSVTAPLHSVYRSWGRVDPEAALAALAREDPKYRRPMSMVLNAMVGEEMARAWALAHPELPEFADWRMEKQSAGPDLSDPAKAAAELSPKSSHHQAYHIANAWAKQAPNAALAWARGLSNPRHRQRAMQAVLDVLLGTDPARARPLIDELPDGLTRAQVEARYTAGLAKNDPQAALLHATETMHGTARFDAIAGIAAIQSQTDPLGALRLLQEHGIGALDRGGLDRVHVDGPGSRMSGNSGTQPLHDVLRAAAPLDPAGVMQLMTETGFIALETNDGGMEDGRGALARALFAEWAARDLPAATQWLSQQPDNPGTAALHKKVTDQWPPQDLAGLQQFATQLPAGAARDQAVAAAAHRLTEHDPDGALAWATQNGGEPALSATFRHLAEIDARATIHHFHESLPPETQYGQRQHLTDQLARRSPVEAIDFFLKRCLPTSRQGSICTIPAWRMRGSIRRRPLSGSQPCLPARPRTPPSADWSTI